MTISRVAVLGDGQMGLVCAGVLAQTLGGTLREPLVRLWGHEARPVESLAQARKSPRLPGFELAEHVLVSTEARTVLEDADLIVAAIPTQYLRSVLTRMRSWTPAGVGVVSVSKGVENGSLLRPTQVIADSLDENSERARRPLAVLSGPTIAPELARCLPATMIAASSDAEFAEGLQKLFTTNWLRIYTGSDPLGVELAGATKNVIAIAAGILDGLQAGYNAKSALLARGLAEIARLGAAMGARSETFFGLAGVGDLATTCFSPEGRNRSCGEALGKGEPLSQYLARTDSVVEGVATTRAVMDLAKKRGVEMPITAAVYAVLYEGLDPIDAISRLMSRELKAERVG